MRISDWSSDVCSSDLQGLRRIGFGQARGQLFAGDLAASLAQLAQPGVERGQALALQRVQGFPEDQLHQVVVGVVAAAVLARKGGRAYQQLAVVDLDELLLQQSLVEDRKSTRLNSSH